jgi:hypothetical protein
VLKAFTGIVHELVSKVTMDAIKMSPICIAMRMFYTTEPAFRNGWKDLIVKILVLRPNLPRCRCYMEGGGTALDQILDATKSQFESCEIGEECLGILEDSGYTLKNTYRSNALTSVDSGHSRSF